MANEEHLAILKQGVDIWNGWRKANKEIRPDLSDAKLARVDLTGVDLSEAKLTRANLHKANLHKAKLYKANLGLANLGGANLSRANLDKVILYKADLSLADLSNGYLSEAKLNRADLSLTNFTEANLTKASLSDTNLRGAILHKAILMEAYLGGADMIGADLSLADLSLATLSNVYLTDANLNGASLREAYLGWAVMIRVDLTGANLVRAYMTGANLTGANLTRAYLTGAELHEANLTGANLRKVNLTYAALVNTILSEATLEDCQIYGISAWDIKLDGANQKSLNISPDDESPILVDDLEVAQFIYLLLNNSKLRNVIDTMGNKAVLILGRFTEERKAVLDAIRDTLRERDYLPILFDFEKPASRDLKETILTLASLSRFIIADLTDAKSIPLELQTIVPNLLSVPVQPIILTSQREFSMFEHISRFPSVLAIHKYESQDSLIKELSEKVIQPAEQKANEMRPKPLS